MDRDGLADFLRRRRAALRPEELGIAVGSRRRTRGLRREEVAARAHISTDFYTRLEQRRGARPSASTVASLAVALRLDRIERNHLFALAGHNAPATTVRRDEPSPGLLRVLERIDGAPAMIVSDLGVTLRQNRLAEALLGDHSVYSGLARSMVYRWFTEPERRALHPAEDHAVRARQHVASLRAVHGRPGPDPEAEELVAALLAASEEFAALWERHEVGSRQASDKRFVHPLVGELTSTARSSPRRTSPSGWSSSAPRPGRWTRRGWGCWPSLPLRRSAEVGAPAVGVLSTSDRERRGIRTG